MDTNELIEKMVKLLERAAYLAEDLEEHVDTRVGVPFTLGARAEALRLDIEDLFEEAKS